MSGILVEYAEKIWSRTTAEYQAIVVAFLFAPAIALAAIWLAGPTSTTRAIAAPPVNIVSLSTLMTGAEASPTSVVIVQPDPLSLTFPSMESPDSIPTSLGVQQWLANGSNIVARDQKITIKSPLAGVTDPLVFVSHEKAPEALEISGRRYALADMRLPTQQATDILLGVLISASFALGVGVASASTPVRPQEHGGG